MTTNRSIIVVILVLAFPATVRMLAAAPATQPARPPRYPLKAARSLVTAAQVKQARELAASHPDGSRVREAIVASAAFWVNRADAKIEDLIPPAWVPRSYSVGNAGCPHCGQKVYERGTYPWILEPEKDLYRIQCPVDGTTYPGNDFRSSLRSDFADRAPAGPLHYDDGWGWFDEQGNRYWFVAYACSWHWSTRIIPGVRDLARAYLLTGEPRYAHTAALMLAEIADRYPYMHYATQSQRGVEYHDPYAWGRILDYVSETNTLSALAEAYDYVWESIDGDAALQARRGQTGEQIRTQIEANLLEEAMDAVWENDVLGNYGMHQQAFALAAICRQNGPVRDWLRQLLDPDRIPHNLHEGFRYALFNAVFREGIPTEVSPAYNVIWPRQIFPVVDLLMEAGMPMDDLRPKLRDMAVAPLRLVLLDRFTPDQGDSGGPYGGLVELNAMESLIAYSRFSHPLLDRWVSERGFLTKHDDFRSLLRPPPPPRPATSEEHTTRLPRARLFDGYGMALFEDASRRWGLSMYFGHIDGHSQRDNLNFDLYGFGQKLMPDLGYPDQTDGYTTGRMSWTSNTIAHNCVMVDRTQPREVGPAEVQRFIAADGLSVIDADARNLVYPQASMYRRAMIMVEPGGGRGYVVDLFRVAGGEEHHYSLHGPPGEVAEVDGRWSEPAPGTLAGPGIPVGYLYDRPVMTEPDYKGTFYDYYGSGFSHFVNCRTLLEGPATVSFRHSRDAGARLQLRLLPGPGDRVISADAQMSPLRYKEMLRYLLFQRSRKTDAPLTSTFAAVLEPYTDEPQILGAERHDLPSGVAVIVHRGDERDVLLYRLGGDDPLEWEGVSTDADVALITLPQGGLPHRAVFSGGTGVVVNGQRIDARTAEARTQAGIVARVVSVDPEQRQAIVQGDVPPDPSALIGRYPAFRHEGRINRHPVIAAESVEQGIRLTFGDELRIGRGKVARFEGDRVVTETKVGMVPGIFPGSRLTDGKYRGFYPVRSVSPAKGREGQFIKEGVIQLGETLPEGFLGPGNEFWLCSFGPGDQVRLEETVTWSR